MGNKNKPVFSVVQNIINKAKGEEEDIRVGAAQDKMKELYTRKVKAQEVVRNIEREIELYTAEIEEEFGEA